MRVFTLAFVLSVSGCSMLPGGEREPTNPRSLCDQYASQAVQADDLETAKNLAARASECYSAAQDRREE